LVWIVDAETRTISVYREGGSITVLSGDAELDGYDVLPGLKLALSKVFNPFA
jgi:Uma2 family endonuclease